MANKIPSDLQWADLVARIKAKVTDANYVHTDNNYTNDDKAKLTGIEAGAEANVIEKVKVNGSALTPTNKSVNITVPTSAADLGALADTTKYGASFSMTINNSTFVITAQLKDQDGNNLGTAQTIDLPLESVVVDGEYVAASKKIVLTLQNGNTVDIPVGDLVAGLQTEITASNKLSADLVDDSTSTNKFVTAAEKTKISNALTELPIASDTVLGGIKVGSGLSIDSTTGVLTATGTSMKLYGTTGQNTDGAMHQKAVTDALPVEFTTTEWNNLWA